MTTKKLTLRQKILVAGTLFGMFFGAGNLIFPVHLGQMAGQNALPAIIGFIITAVGIPILGVAAIGVTHSDGLQTLSGKVSKGLGITMMTEIMMRGRTQGVRTLPVSPKAGRELGMGMHLSRNTPEEILRLRACVLDFTGGLS